MKKAVIYARYSSDKQTEQSIEGQLHVCRDYAKRNNIIIVDTYIDRAMTGTNDNRLEFQTMLKDSNNKTWDYVLVYKIDRFSRNKYEMAMHKKTLRDNGVKLVSAMENIPDTPEGIILESLLEGMAEYYSAELSQKVKRGKRESRTKGLFTGGYVPFGYKVENKKILINKEQAEIVNYMYEQYSKGVFIRDIITELDNLGITNNTKKPFTKTVVHRILTDEKYIGIYRFKGEIFTNLYPQIVPNELYEIVQTKNKDNVHGGRKTDANYILSKKIKCGYCGNNINANTGTSKTGKVYRYYSCTGVTVKKTCNKKNVRKDELEELVMNAIYKAFDNPITITTLAEDIVTRHKEKIQNQSVLKLLQNELASINKSIKNVLTAIDNGITTKLTAKHLQELEQRQEELENKILVEQNKEAITLSQAEIISFIKKALSYKSKSLVNVLIDKILLYDDKIEIFCNYTNIKGPDGDNPQDLLFYTEKAQISELVSCSMHPNKKDILINFWF